MKIRGLNRYSTTYFYSQNLPYYHARHILTSNYTNVCTILTFVISLPKIDVCRFCLQIASLHEVWRKMLFIFSIIDTTVTVSAFVCPRCRLIPFFYSCVCGVVARQKSYLYEAATSNILVPLLLFGPPDTPARGCHRRVERRHRFGFYSISIFNVMSFGLRNDTVSNVKDYLNL